MRSILNWFNWIGGRLIGNVSRFDVPMSNGLLLWSIRYFSSFHAFGINCSKRIRMLSLYRMQTWWNACLVAYALANSPSTPSTIVAMHERAHGRKKRSDAENMPRFLFRFGHLSVDLCNTCSSDTHNTWMWVGECARAGETALVFVHCIWMHSTWDTSLSSSSCSNTAVDLVDHGLRARNFACFWWHCWLWVAIIIPSEGNFVVSIWIVHDSRQRTWHSINFDEKATRFAFASLQWTSAVRMNSGASSATAVSIFNSSRVSTLPISRA